MDSECREWGREKKKEERGVEIQETVDGGVGGMGWGLAHFKKGRVPRVYYLPRFRPEILFYFDLFRDMYAKRGMGGGDRFTRSLSPQNCTFPRAPAACLL